MGFCGPSKSVSFAEVPSITVCTAPIYIVLINSTYSCFANRQPACETHLQQYDLKVGFFQYWSKWFDLIFTYLNVHSVSVLRHHSDHPKSPSSKFLQVAGVTGFHHVADVARLFVETLPGAVRCPGAHVSGVKACHHGFWISTMKMKRHYMFEQSKNSLIPISLQ